MYASTKRFGWFTAILCVSLNGLAQPAGVWDLRRCISYALENNISIQQTVIQQRINKIEHQQSIDEKFGNLSLQGSSGEQIGRNIDPATNQFTSNNVGFVNLGIQGGVTLFNWFARRNIIAANEFTYQASGQQTKKMQEDVALNVSAGYLQALQNKEQLIMANAQVAQTKEQLANTRLRVKAGSLPELNAAEVEAQLARDSASLISVQSAYRLSLLQLKALLNLDMAAAFDIAEPELENFEMASLSELAPELVYQQALGYRPQLQAGKFRLLAAQKNTAVIRASRYPTIAAFLNLQTTYSTALKQLPKGNNISTIVPTQAFVNINGSPAYVNTPVLIPERFVHANLFRQFSNNLRQGIGVSVQMPLFNGYQARHNYNKSLQNEASLRLQMQADSLQLKQDIYSAYQNAVNAMANFNSRQKAFETASYSYSLAKQRYEIGLLPVFELLQLQNNVQRTFIDQVTARYEYIFRTKVLEFYRGTGFQLN